MTVWTKFGRRRFVKELPAKRIIRHTTAWLPVGLAVIAFGVGCYVGNAGNGANIAQAVAIMMVIGGSISVGYSWGSYREHIKLLTQYRLIGEDRPDPIPPWCTKCWIHCAVTEGEYKE